MNENGLRFGVYIPAYSYPDEEPPPSEFIQDFARRAERLGFDSLWVADHLFESVPSYRVVFMEPLTVLTMAAAATERVGLGTGILVLPLRDPVLTAKALATLDAASHGRVIFGAGVGWVEKEFQACQVPKRTRGKRMDEMLEIIRGLWTEDTFSYHGELFDIPEVSLIPKPIQQPHPPIWIAGAVLAESASAHLMDRGYTPHRSLARAARASAILTTYRAVQGMDVSRLRTSWELVCEEAERIGRDPSTLTFAHQDHLHIDPDGARESLSRVVDRFTFRSYEEMEPLYLMGRPDDLIPRIQARIDAGVQELVFNLLTPDPNQLELFMSEIRPHLRPRFTSSS